jgi:protein-tyrosine phosphatase
MGSILFVCTANICRSPMAAALFLESVKNWPEGQLWRVESAGIWAQNGQPACAGAKAAMRSRGLNISRHRSRVVTAEMLESFSLILTMEKSQQEAIRVEFPGVARRVYLLSEMAGRRIDVNDPFGGEPRDYEATAAELSELITEGMNKIFQLADPIPGTDHAVGDQLA